MMNGVDGVPEKIGMFSNREDEKNAINNNASPGPIVDMSMHIDRARTTGTPSLLIKRSENFPARKDVKTVQHHGSADNVPVDDSDV